MKYIPFFPEPGGLRKERRKGVFHVMCPSSGEADVEDNCSSKDCGVDDGNGSLSKCNSTACSNEDHIVRDVEGMCGEVYCRSRLQSELQAMNERDITTQYRTRRHRLQTQVKKRSALN